MLITFLNVYIIISHLTANVHTLVVRKEASDPETSNISIDKCINLIKLYHIFKLKYTVLDNQKRLSRVKQSLVQMNLTLH